MKRVRNLSLLILVAFFWECNKTEIDPYDLQLNFRNEEGILAKYNEILAYDSIQFVFQLNKTACDRIRKNSTPVYPDPNFAFGVYLNDELVYTISFIPAYYSYSYPERIKFYSIGNEFLKLYVEMDSLKTQVNNKSILELFAKDGKLKSLDL